MYKDWLRMVRRSSKLSNTSSFSLSEILNNPSQSSSMRTPSILLPPSAGSLISSSGLFFCFVALYPTLVKIHHKLHWAARLRLKGSMWHVQCCRRWAMQEEGEGRDSDMPPTRRRSRWLSKLGPWRRGRVTTWRPRASSVSKISGEGTYWHKE